MNDDLAGLFADSPEQPSLDMRYRQGVILSFNQTTLQNTVLVGGTVMTDLQLLGVGEATLLVPGAVVGIVTIGEATKTMFIAGRVVTPNTADATDAIALLNTQIYTSSIYTGETCTSTSYTDLATIGPTVTVPITSSGRILIIATAQMQWATPGALTTFSGGRFDVAFSGANSRTPNEAVDQLVGCSQIQVVTTTNNQNSGIFSVTTQANFTSLNAGATTITMKYRKVTGATADVDFFRRTLTVFKL